MTYVPEKGALVCPYCQKNVVLERSIPIARDFYRERNAGEVYEGESLYECPNCGGQVELENFETVAECPFCGSDNIVRKEAMEGLRPDSILPFAIGSEQALKLGKSWLKKRIFAPHKLKKNFAADKFKGVYVPSFSFDSDTITQYSGRLGQRKTRVVGTGKNRRVETYIDWFYVSGVLPLDFDNLVTEASAQIEQKEMNKVLPFDLNNAEGYKKEYLAGFSAERYSASLDSSFGVAKETMDAAIKRAIMNKHHADVMGDMSISTNFARVSFRYMLLPLWLCSYKYREKSYRFIVNGRTGESTGKTPLSPLRVGSLAVFIAGIIGVLVWLFAFSGIIN